MTEKQVAALTKLCQRYNVEFAPEAFTPQFDLPTGFVAGWVSNLYVGCSPEGEIHS